MIHCKLYSLCSSTRHWKELKYTKNLFFVASLSWTTGILAGKFLPSSVICIAVIKVHFKIVGSDCNFAHNFLVWTQVLKILIAFESCWKKLDFTCKIKWKMKKKSCQKWRWKNTTHRNLIAMAFKFDKYVAAYLCIHPSQHLSI